ncbi:glycosyltransferase family 2 protein [Paenibacillus sp. sgz302251]|uniref:glycosyltransferase family 2 protein n=1 Tax=Paenibacillus sp. sgz302251 TaxID=3414493 RepID=UPI003C79C52F
MVSVICCSIREQFMENVFENYDKQTIKKKELIIILNEEEMDIANWRARAARSKDVSVYKMPHLTLGECLNFGIKKSRYNIIAKYDDDDYYAPNYLAQQVRSLQRKGADMACKRTVFMYFEEKKTLAIHLAHRKVKRFIQRNNGVKGSTLVFKKKLWKHVKFHPINVGEDSLFIKQCLEEQFKIFVTDRYNYVCVRRDEKQHTWKSNNDKLMKKSKILYVTEEYRQAVEKVPKQLHVD